MTSLPHILCLLAAFAAPVTAVAQDAAAPPPAGEPKPEGEAAAGGGDVRLKLARPFAEGQIFSCAAVARTYRHFVVSTGGAVVNETKTGRRCQLAATVGIRELHPDGRIAALSLWVYRLTSSPGYLGTQDEEEAEPGRDGPLLADGVQVSARYPEGAEGEVELALADGGELPAEAVAALRLLLPQPEGPAACGRAFEPDAPVPPGAPWPVDPKRVAKALGEGGIEVDPERLEGEAVLLPAGDADRPQTLEVTLRGDRAGVTLPDGYVTRSGTLRAQLRSVLPAEVERLVLGDESEYTLHSQAMGREGDALMVVDIVIDQRRHARYRELRR